jgi:hypothetical protein
MRTAQRLADAGARLLAAPAREALLSFAASRRTPDGLFRGRGGDGGDLYYAVFGFGLLGALGAAQEVASAASGAAALPAEAAAGMDLVHAVALARVRATAGLPPSASLLSRVEAFRTRDGGYHLEGSTAPHAQVHASHLAMLAYEAAGQPWPASGAAPAFVGACTAPGGGYGNEPGAEAGTTPATAAALALLGREGRDDPDALRWLRERRDPSSGGFRAGPATDGPDLLCTAAALFALRQRDALPAEAADGALGFVERCWNPDGGFGGVPGDSVSDVEYSWYALLALGAALA